MKYFIVLHSIFAAIVFVNSTSIEISSASVTLPEPEGLINIISRAIFDVYKSSIVAVHKYCSDVSEAASDKLKTAGNEISASTFATLNALRPDVNAVFENFNAALSKLSYAMNEASNLGETELEPALVVWNELKYGVRRLKRNIRLIRANMNKTLVEIKENFEEGTQQFTEAMKNIYTKVLNKLCFEVRSASNMFQHALSLPDFPYYEIDLEEIYKNWTQFLYSAKETPTSIFKSARSLLNQMYNAVQTKFFLSGILSDNSLWPSSSIVWGDAAQVKRFVDNSLQRLTLYIKASLTQIHSKFGKDNSASQEAIQSLYNQVYHEINQLIYMTEIPYKRVYNFSVDQTLFSQPCSLDTSYRGKFQDLLKYLQSSGYPVETTLAECTNSLYQVPSNNENSQSENFFDYLLDDAFRKSSPSIESLPYPKILHEEQITEITNIYKYLFDLVQKCAATADEDGYKLPKIISMKMEDDAYKYTVLMNDLRMYTSKCACYIETSYDHSSQEYKDMVNNLCEDIKNKLDIAAAYTFHSIQRIDSYFEKHQSCLEKFVFKSDLSEEIIASHVIDRDESITNVDKTTSESSISSTSLLISSDYKITDSKLANTVSSKGNNIKLEVPPSIINIQPDNIEEVITTAAQELNPNHNKEVENLMDSKVLKHAAIATNNQDTTTSKKKSLIGLNDLETIYTEKNINKEVNKSIDTTILQNEASSEENQPDNIEEVGAKMRRTSSDRTSKISEKVASEEIKSNFIEKTVKIPVVDSHNLVSNKEDGTMLLYGSNTKITTNEDSTLSIGDSEISSQNISTLGDKANESNQVFKTSNSLEETSKKEITEFSQKQSKVLEEMKGADNNLEQLIADTKICEEAISKDNSLSLNDDQKECGLDLNIASNIETIVDKIKLENNKSLETKSEFNEQQFSKNFETSINENISNMENKIDTTVTTRECNTNIPLVVDDTLEIDKQITTEINEKVFETKSVQEAIEASYELTQPKEYSKIDNIDLNIINEQNLEIEMNKILGDQSSMIKDFSEEVTNTSVSNQSSRTSITDLEAHIAVQQDEEKSVSKTDIDKNVEKEIIRDSKSNISISEPEKYFNSVRSLPSENVQQEVEAELIGYKERTYQNKDVQIEKHQEETSSSTYELNTIQNSITSEDQLEKLLSTSQEVTDEMDSANSSTNEVINNNQSVTTSRVHSRRRIKSLQNDIPKIYQTSTSTKEQSINSILGESLHKNAIETKEATEEDINVLGNKCSTEPIQNMAKSKEELDSTNVNSYVLNNETEVTDNLSSEKNLVTYKKMSEYEKTSLNEKSITSVVDTPILQVSEVIADKSKDCIIEADSISQFEGDQLQNVLDIDNIKQNDSPNSDIFKSDASSTITISESTVDEHSITEMNTRSILNEPSHDETVTRNTEENVAEKFSEIDTKIINDDNSSEHVKLTKNAIENIMVEGPQLKDVLEKDLNMDKNGILDTQIMENNDSTAKIKVTKSSTNLNVDDDDNKIIVKGNNAADIGSSIHDSSTIKQTELSEETIKTIASEDIQLKSIVENDLVQKIKTETAVDKHCMTDTSTESLNVGNNLSDHIELTGGAVENIASEEALFNNIVETNSIVEKNTVTSIFDNDSALKTKIEDGTISTTASTVEKQSIMETSTRSILDQTSINIDNDDTVIRKTEESVAEKFSTEIKNNDNSNEHVKLTKNDVEDITLEGTQLKGAVEKDLNIDENSILHTQIMETGDSTAITKLIKSSTNLNVNDDDKIIVEGKDVADIIKGDTSIYDSSMLEQTVLSEEINKTVASEDIQLVQKIKNEADTTLKSELSIDKHCMTDTSTNNVKVGNNLSDHMELTGRTIENIASEAAQLDNIVETNSIVEKNSILDGINSILDDFTLKTKTEDSTILTTTSKVEEQSTTTSNVIVNDDINVVKQKEIDQSPIQEALENIKNTRDSTTTTTEKDTTMEKIKVEGEDISHESPLYGMLWFPHQPRPPKVQPTPSVEDNYNWFGWLVPGIRNTFSRSSSNKVNEQTSSSKEQKEVSNSKNVEVESETSYTSSKCESTQSSVTKIDSNIEEDINAQIPLKLDGRIVNRNADTESSKINIGDSDCLNSKNAKPEEPKFMEKWYNSWIKIK